jgi:hypothetical protein
VPKRAVHADDPELTEIVKAEIDRVDGVLSPANGTGVLLMKSLADPLAKAEDGKVPCTTCDGKGKIMEGKRDCPDCDATGKVAKAAGHSHMHAHGDGTHEHAHEHEAEHLPADGMMVPHSHDHEPTDPGIGDQVDSGMEKAAMSGAAVNDLPDSAFAHIEPGGEKDGSGSTTPRSKRHFPVHDEAHARNALSRLSSSPFGDSAKPKVHAAARKFGIEVSKAEGEERPGSPGWEAQDAAALRSAASQLADLRSRVATSRDREAAEDDPYDWDNASDLDCAVQALDCALGIVARLAFTEQVEAMKPDDAVEKAGRRLSAKTIQAIHAARDHLAELLGEDTELSAEDGGTEVTKAELDTVLAALTAPITDLTKALQAGTSSVPTPAPTPAGASLAAGFGSEASIEARQHEALPGNEEVPESPNAPDAQGHAGAPALGEPEPEGSRIDPGRGPIEADVARQERHSGAPAGRPPQTLADMDGDVTKSTPPGPDTEALLKALTSSVADAVGAAVKPLEDRFAAVEKRVKEIAEAPMPGGPMLKGTLPPQFRDVHMTRREDPTGQAAPTGDVEELRKALASVADPSARDLLGRQLALQAMPFTQR